jgi:hypothetical protein
MAEALTFGTFGLAGLAGLGWAMSMVVRALTTLMHATVGGIGGLGVSFIATGRRRQGLGLLAAAWLVHAAWNSGVLLSQFAALAAGTGLTAAEAVAVLAAASVVLLFGLVLITFRSMSRAMAALELGAIEPVPGPVAPLAGPPDAATEPAEAPLPVPHPAADEAPPGAEPEPEGIPGLGPEPGWPPAAPAEPDRAGDTGPARPADPWTPG